MTTTSTPPEATTRTAPDRIRVPVRVGMLLLAVPQLVTGGWAVLDPRGWYDNFPGFGPLLAAADPPFNAHLTTDAGAGFLATGVILVAAAVWGERGAARLALAGLLTFAVAHLIYHAANPAPGLTEVQNTVNVIVLIAGVLATVVLLLGTGLRVSSRRAPDRS